MRHAIATRSLSLSYGDTTIIQDLNLQVPQGEITVLIGANGCGKSTLIRSIARLLKPSGGSVLIEGKSIASMATREVARKMAILPQSPVAPEGLTVYQLIKQGRYPHQSWFKQWSDIDERKVQHAIMATGLTELQHRFVDELSGGQRQRAWIAMTLAQDTDTILLDEPTTYLDMSHQIEILDLLFDLNKRERRTIIMVLHDLNLACRYAHHIVAIKDGSVYVEGRPEDVINCDVIRHVFDMECQVMQDPVFGTPLCIPFGKGRCIMRTDTAAGVASHG